jgi:CheY-like chemotaxis protein
MSGESILVVEDEGLIALHLTELLENAGYQVIGPVSSGEKALSAARESPRPGLVLMDVRLAGQMDGIEAARLIREHFPVPIIFLTAYSSDRTIERIGDLEHEGYLTKPVVGEALLAAIRRVFAGKTGKKD